MHKINGWQESSLNAIKPTGWLRSFLDHQRTGLTGHLEVAGYPFNTEGWLADHLPLSDRGGSGWWPYEQIAYWVDGMMRCGLLMDNDFLKKKARRSIDHVMLHPDPDGYLGPDAMKTLNGEQGSERWPHAVFFRAVLADYHERPSKRTLQLLTRHYLSNTAPHGANRNACNIEIMAWLYEQTGDIRIKKLAESTYRDFQRLQPKDGATLKNMAGNQRIGDHGPRHMELFKLGAIMYRLTGNRTYLKATLNAHRKLKRDHMLIDGVPSTTEHLRGIYSTAGHETCVITDYLWALGHLLMATKDATMADEMEKICFNALPGAVTPDFKALQYFSGPNQVVAGPQTNHHPHGIGCAHISYRPNPATECCPGNVHRAMPAYAGRMWMEDGKGGIIAALYGPSHYTFGKAKKRVIIHEETEYPFDDQITFRFECRDPVAFAFQFRIPEWCKKPLVLLNGNSWSGKYKPGSFARISRIFSNNDRIVVHLPKSLRIVKGPEEGVGVEWGPVVLSLNIKSKAVIVPDVRSTAEFPAWTMTPASPWNVGLVLKNTRVPSDWKLAIRKIQSGSWFEGPPPVTLTVPIRKIAGWKLIRKKKLTINHGNKTHIHEGDIIFMPPLPDARLRDKASRREMTAELIPYGSTRLRVTWFPVVR